MASKPEALKKVAANETEQKVKPLPAIESLLKFEPPKRDAKKAAKPKRPLLGKLRLRHTIIGSAFIALVAVPAIVASLYLFLIAQDQYHSSASFSVRSIDSAASADILGMFTQASSNSTSSDSYVLLDYIQSIEMVRKADESFNLSDVFARRGGDFFYSMGSDLPIEDKLDYWRGMVDVNYDHTSGIINLTVRTFDPQSAQQLANFILAESERIVNDLSQKARGEVLRVAQEEVRLAETRLSDARLALRNFRGSAQEADPIKGAELASQLIATLEQQLVQLNADLRTAEAQMSDDTPRIRVIKSRIDSLEQQIALERQRFGTGTATKTGRDPGNDVAGRILQYETLETEREFGERAYTSALASLEKARLDANGQQRYLAVFVNPSPSELAQYPNRLLSLLLVALGSLFVWGVGVMGYYNIRDRN